MIGKLRKNSQNKKKLDFARRKWEDEG